MSKRVPSIFISYRRQDSADVLGRINDYLVHQFGKDSIFRDIDSIPAGQDFRTHLRNALDQCKVCLVIMGPGWLTAQLSTGVRRLDDTRDHHRIEIETALGRDIAVIPVLIQGMSMPDEEQLPESIRALANRNAREVRRDPDFQADMDRLVREIQRYVPLASAGVSRSKFMAAAIVLAFVALTAVLVQFRSRGNNEAPKGSGAQPHEVVGPTEIAPPPGREPQPKTQNPTLVASANPRPSNTATLKRPDPVTPPVEPKADRQTAFQQAAAGNCEPLGRLADSEPNDGNVFYELGRCQASQSQWSAARQSLSRALEAGQPPAKIHTELGRVALAAGDLTETNRQVDLALKAQPGSAPALLLRGDMLMKQRQYGQAANTYDVVFQRTKSREACERLADAYEKNGAEELGQNTRSGCAVAQ